MARSAADQQKIDAYVTALQGVLAPDRLAAYRPAGGDDLAMVSTYFWNAALSRDLHLVLGAVEVSMRNGMHAALSAHTGHANWYDRIVLLARESKRIRIAKKTIKDAKKPVIPGRVVAGLTFDFWTSLLSAGAGPSGYGATLWSPNNAALVKLAFPNLQAPHDNRSYAHRRFNTLRLLRNRTSHHEPIWQGMTLLGKPTLPLADLYADALDAIGWVSPELQASIVAYDRFPDTLQNGLVAQEKAITDHLGIS
jgi:hypothetical protein